MTGFEFGHNSQAVAAVLTDKGRVECDYVAVGAGPWVRDLWAMLDLPKTVSIKGRDGARASRHSDVALLAAGGRRARGRARLSQDQ